MSWILAIALLAAAPDVATVNVPVDRAVTEVRPLLQTGSLIFSQGDCLAVRVYTASPYTHVGCVVCRDGEVVVYDSTAGAGVRRQPLAAYLVSQIEHEIAVYAPSTALSPSAADRFDVYLQCQMGRPYSLTHHLTGRSSDGLHCAEYAAEALAAAGLLNVERPAQLSPASLLERIGQDGLYAVQARVQIESPEAAQVVGATWCEQMWLDTKRCTTRCYGKMRAWFCCK